MLPAGKTSNQQHSQAGFIFRSFLSWVLFRCQSKELEVHISAQPATPSSWPDLSEERAVTYIRSPACVGLPKPPSIAPLRFIGFIMRSTLIHCKCSAPNADPEHPPKPRSWDTGLEQNYPELLKALPPSSPLFLRVGVPAAAEQDAYRGLLEAVGPEYTGRPFCLETISYPQAAVAASIPARVGRRAVSPGPRHGTDVPTTKPFYARGIGVCFLRGETRSVPMVSGAKRRLPLFHGASAGKKERFVAKRPEPELLGSKNSPLKSGLRP